VNLILRGFQGVRAEHKAQAVAIWEIVVGPSAPPTPQGKAPTGGGGKPVYMNAALFDMIFGKGTPPHLRKNLKSIMQQPPKPPRPRRR
jgi:hypothetical protein